MPIYDFKCSNCGEVKEKIIFMWSDVGSQYCDCGGKQEKLLPKSVNIIYKGPGFYHTDNKEANSG